MKLRDPSALYDYDHEDELEDLEQGRRIPPGKVTRTSRLYWDNLDASGHQGPASKNSSRSSAVAPGKNTSAARSGLARRARNEFDAAFLPGVIGNKRNATASPDSTPRAAPKLSGAAGRLFEQGAAGASTELPYRDEMEQLFATDFSTVQTHVGQAGPLEGLMANAAASGERLLFSSAAPSRDQVVHELTHVMQFRKHGAPSGTNIGSSSANSEAEARQLAGMSSNGPLPSVAAAPAASIQLDDGEAQLRRLQRGVEQSANRAWQLMESWWQAQAALGVVGLSSELSDRPRHETHRELWEIERAFRHPGAYVIYRDLNLDVAQNLWKAVLLAAGTAVGTAILRGLGPEGAIAYRHAQQASIELQSWTIVGPAASTIRLRTGLLSRGVQAGESDSDAGHRPTAAGPNAAEQRQRQASRSQAAQAVAEEQEAASDVVDAQVAQNPELRARIGSAGRSSRGARSLRQHSEQVAIDSNAWRLDWRVSAGPNGARTIALGDAARLRQGERVLFTLHHEQQQVRRLLPQPNSWSQQPTLTVIHEATDEEVGATRMDQMHQFAHEFQVTGSKRLELRGSIQNQPILVRLPLRVLSEDEFAQDLDSTPDPERDPVDRPSRVAAMSQQGTSSQRYQSARGQRDEQDSEAREQRRSEHAGRRTAARQARIEALTARPQSPRVGAVLGFTFREPTSVPDEEFPDYVQSLSHAIAVTPTLDLHGRSENGWHYSMRYERDGADFSFFEVPIPSRSQMVFRNSDGRVVGLEEVQRDHKQRNIWRFGAQDWIVARLRGESNKALFRGQDLRNDVLWQQFWDGMELVSILADVVMPAAALRHLFAGRAMTALRGLASRSGRAGLTRNAARRVEQGLARRGAARLGVGRTTTPRPPRLGRRGGPRTGGALAAHLSAVEAQAVLRALTVLIQTPRQVFDAGLNALIGEVHSQLVMYVRQNVTGTPTNRTLEQYLRGEIPGLNFEKILNKAASAALGVMGEQLGPVVTNRPSVYRAGLRGIYHRTATQVVSSVGERALQQYVTPGRASPESLLAGVTGAVGGQLESDFSTRLENWRERLERRAEALDVIER